MNSQIVAAVELLLEALQAINDKSTRLLIIEAINALGQITLIE